MASVVKRRHGKGLTEMGAIIVKLIRRSELGHWLDLGWLPGLPWWHPVQAAYDRCYVWRKD